MEGRLRPATTASSESSWRREKVVDKATVHRMSETPGFTVLRVEPAYSRSRALGMGREPRAPIASGYVAVHVKCNACGHAWRAPKSLRGDAGYFYPLQGHMQIVCPRCGQEHVIENPPLP